MTSNDTPAAASAPSAHVLARALATRIALKSDAAHAPRVLVLGIGSGRNLPPLLAAGLHVDAVDDDAERVRILTARFAPDARVRVAHASYAGPFGAAYDGALSTHAFLHGDERAARAALAATRRALRTGAPLCATFGSTIDPRYGSGRRIDGATFAPLVGPETGIPHVYFDESRLRAILEDFTIESIEETRAAEHVGTWAHDPGDAATIVHWFVRATARER